MARLSVTNTATEYFASMNADQRRRVVKVLKRVMQEEKAAGYFNDPVDAEGLGIPEYRDIVKEPMDLTQILQRVEEGLYSSVAGVLEDVLLVWSNCRLFNEPGSDVCAACDEVASIFEKLWRQNGLEKWAKPGDELAGNLASGGRSSDPARSQSSPKMPTQRAGPSGEARPHKAKAGKGKRQQAFTLEDLRNGHPLERCLKAITFTCSHPQAAAFNTTLAQMDKPNLQTILGLLEPGRTKGWGTVSYKSTAEVLRDVRRVWSVCRASFLPNSPMPHMCNALQQAFESLWSHAGLLSEQEPTSNERSVDRSQKRKAAEAPPPRERESSPPARQPPPAAGHAAYHAGPHRPGQRVRSGICVRLPTPPLEDLSELVDFDNPDIAYEDLAQGPRKRPTSSGRRPSPALPPSIAGSSKDASGNSPAVRVEQPPLDPPRMDISAALRAAEIQPWERKVLEQYAQLQAIRKQATLAMEYAKDAVARMRAAQAELQAATAAAEQLKFPEKPPPEIWPPDAPLVGSTVVAQPPEKPKELPEHVMALGKALFATYSMQESTLKPTALPGVAGPETAAGTQPELGKQRTEHEGGFEGMTAWQRRLQSSVPLQTLQKEYHSIHISCVDGRQPVK